MSSEEAANSDTPNERTPEADKHFANRILTRIDIHQKFSADQVASMAKWLMASLLAVNGGGAIASINALANGHNTSLASAFFGAGIIIALVSGVAMQDVYNNVSEPLLDQDNYWTNVAINGERDAEMETSLNAASQRILRFAFIPTLLGWISGILFLAGAINLAADVADRDEAAERRCIALQNDMLTSTPKRDDSIKLYEAFGCKPNGEGAVHARR